MKKTIIYIITILLLTILLIFFIFVYLNKKRDLKKLEQNAISNNIYFNNDTYINKLQTDKNNLEKEILTKYNTIEEDNINKIINEINSKIDNTTKYITDKNEEKKTLISQKESLNNQYAVLKKKQEEAEEIKRINEIKKNNQAKLENETKNKTVSNIQKINNIKTYNQYPNYPTGCESVALYILLNYYNVNVTVENIIEKLPKSPMPYEENSVLYGGNPNIEFIGDPRSKNSHGVYDKPIALVANNYKSSIINGTGKSLSEVLKTVKENKPVIVWTSINLALPYISKSWIYKPTGEKIDWIGNEHAVVLIGQTEDSVIISDPIDGTIKSQNKKTFEQRYNSYGKRNLYY